MRYLLLIILCSSCLRCGYEEVVIIPHPLPIPHWDSELLDYYEDYVADLAAYNVYVPGRSMVRVAEFRETGPELLGYCQTFFYNEGGEAYRVVVIHPKVTNILVIYHEFSHCFLNLDHSEDRNNIMYPSLHPTITVNFRLKMDTTFENIYNNKFIQPEDWRR